MTDADKLAIQEARGPSWKKVLLWTGVGLLIVTGITILLVVLLRKKSPAAATNEIINDVKHRNFRADIEAKIEVAKARAVEDSVIRELERIKDIDNVEEQARRLAAIL